METGGGPCIPPPDSDENDPVIDAILTNVTDIEVPCIDSDAIMTGEYVLSPKSGRLVEKDFSPDSSFEGKSIILFSNYLIYVNRCGETVCLL